MPSIMCKVNSQIPAFIRIHKCKSNEEFKEPLSLDPV